jgi:hypothetical protein
MPFMACLFAFNYRSRQAAPALAADNSGEREGEEEAEEGEKEEEGMDDKEEQVSEGRPHKMRRLSDDHFIDLTDDEPMTAITSSAPSSATHMATPVSVRAVLSVGSGHASAQSAVFNGRRAMPAVGGGGPEGSTQRLSLPTQPLPGPGRAVPDPAPLPLPRIKAEASAAQPTAQDGLKMTLLEAVNILGPEAFRRLAACEEGSEEIGSLDRLVDLFQQVSSLCSRTAVHLKRFN